MRSDIIYDAITTVKNRYTLCQLASKATRRFHRPSTRMQDTMNEVLSNIGQKEPQMLMEHPENFIEPERRAA